MSVHNIELELAKILGFASAESFRRGTSLELSGLTASHDNYLHVKFADPFLASYAQWSSVYINPQGNLSDLDKAKLILSRVRAKIKQTKTLEEIRLKCFDEVRKAIHEAYGYDLDIIKNEDIKFPRGHNVAVGPFETYYNGTIADKSFELTLSSYFTFQNMNKMVLEMREFLDKKQAEYDSKR